MELNYLFNRKREIEPTFVRVSALTQGTMLGILFVTSFNPHNNEEILNLSLISMDEKI